MKQPYHYIVIDDDPTNNLICRLVIERFDREADIKLYTSPEKALSEIQHTYKNSFIPTIVFLDINMPVMTGWEFLEKFRSLDEQVKRQFSIFILSSSVEDFSEKTRLYPFLSGFYSKPLKNEYLEEIQQSLQQVQSLLEF